MIWNDEHLEISPKRIKTGFLYSIFTNYPHLKGISTVTTWYIVEGLSFKTKTVIAGVAGGGGLLLIILVIIIVILRFKRLSIEHFCLLNLCVMLNLMSIERFSSDLEMKTREQTERLRIVSDWLLLLKERI